MRTCTKWGVGVASALLAAAGAAHGAVGLTPIALGNTSGIYGPGTAPGEFFAVGTSFQGFCINSNGQVIFTNGTISPTTDGGQFVWSAQTYNVIKARSGVTSSPYGGTFTNSFVGNIINDAGLWVHREGTGATAKLYVNNGGTYAGIARGGGTFAAFDAAGGSFADVFFASPSNGHFLNGSNYAFGSTLSGAGTTTAAGVNNTEGLWIGDPTAAGGMKLVLRRNDSLTTNTRVGAFAGQLSVQNNMALNGSGKYALVTASSNGLQGSDITASSTTGNDQALLSNRSGSLAMIAQRGQVADASDGAKYRVIGGAGSGPIVALNNSGKIAFQTTLREGSITAGVTNHSALFTDHDGSSLWMVARTGRLIPTYSGLPQATGVAGGAAWGTGFNDVLMNDAGKIVFRVTGMTGTGVTLNTNDSAIFTKNTYDPAPRVLAQANNHADGISTLLDVRYQGFSSLAMNAYGQVVFTASFTGADVIPGTGGTNNALYATDSAGNICLVLRRGFDINGGTTGSIINSYNYVSSSNNDGRQATFNDKGQLVVAVAFTDGTNGLYAFSIPSASSLPALALGGLFAARRRRNH